MAQDKTVNGKLDPKNRIKKYLQIDELNIPETLDEINFEIKQNTIDVVLNSPKYIFLTSKRDKVVNKNYKDYNSLKVKLKKSSSKSYVADIHLENWYSAKYDRKFQVILSKYNLLTDLRMGIYELLYGKVYVRKNREKLIQYSAIRIKKIREMAKKKENNDKNKSKTSGGKSKKEEPDAAIAPNNKKKSKKKPPASKKEEEDVAGTKGDDKEKKEETAEKGKDEPKDKKTKEDLAGDESSKNKKKNKKKKADSEEEDEEKVEEVALPVDPEEKRKEPDPRIAAAFSAEEPEKEKDSESQYNLLEASDIFNKQINIFINKLSKFTAYLLYTNYSVNSSNYLLETSLDMTFVRFGASIQIIQEKVNPIAYEFLLLAGTSVENDVVQIPAWRTIEAKASKYILSNLFQIGVAIESSPYFFINVPQPGEGIQLYQNDIIYAKGFAALHFRLFKRAFTVGASYASALSVSSTIENYKATAVKTEVYGSYFITQKYGLAFSSETYNFSGTDQGEAANSTGTNYSLNFVAKFN